MKFLPFTSRFSTSGSSIPVSRTIKSSFDFTHKKPEVYSPSDNPVTNALHRIWSFLKSILGNFGKHWSPLVLLIICYSEIPPYKKHYVFQKLHPYLFFKLHQRLLESQNKCYCYILYHNFYQYLCKVLFPHLFFRSYSDFKKTVFTRFLTFYIGCSIKRPLKGNPSMSILSPFLRIKYGICHFTENNILYKTYAINDCRATLTSP